LNRLHSNVHQSAEHICVLYIISGVLMSKNPNITGLNAVGQSIWYDNLSREVLKSGELSSLIASGVSGLTSNPTIFKKAIADSSNYDSDVKALSAQGLSNDDICETLMVGDVATAADLLRPIYDATSGEDGYASIEVSPTLAHDAAGTVQAAKRIWGKLARPNAMIKIPATEAGIVAIKETLAAGINVNVTLIFSKEVYEKVALAYIEALEERAQKGLSVGGIASVASFFVSRVDAICEKKFDALLKEGKVQESQRALIFGKIGIANSKVAYEAFEKLFTGARFKALSAKGALVQRPLWASTGTKNPSLSAVLYIEELAGKHTVNTVPPATLTAILKGLTAEPRLHAGLNEAKKVLADLESLHIPLHELLVTLQKEGVVSFADSYRELVESFQAKR
jgi:transaldolase